MALNRYSSLPKANIRSSQSLVDLGIIDGALQRQQKVYDTEAATVQDAVKSGQQLDFLEGKPQEFKERLNQDLKAKVGEWSTLDLADPNVKAQVNGYISELASNPELKKHTIAKQAYDKYSEELGKMEAEGNYNPANVYAYEKEWNRYKTTGEFNPALANPRILKNQDINKEGKEFFDMLKPDEADSIASLTDKDISTYYKNSSKGISGNKIFQQFKRNENTWLNSNAGRQLMNEYYMKEDQGIKTGSSSAQEYASKALLNVGKGYQFSSSSTNLDDRLNQHNKTKKEEELMLTGSEEFKVNGIDSNRAHNSDGSRRSQESVMSKLFGTGWGMDAPMTEEERNKPENKNAELAAKAMGMTVAEYDEHFGKKQSIPVWNYVNETKRKALSSLLSDKGAGILNSATVIDKDGKKSTFKDIIESKYGKLDAEELKKVTEQMQVTGRVEPSAVAADGYRISAGGEDYILDLTNSLAQKIQAGKHTKDDINRVNKYREEFFKSGQIETQETQEGTAIQFWNPKSGKIEWKLVD